MVLFVIAEIDFTASAFFTFICTQNNLHALRNRHEQCKMSQFSLSMRNQIKMPILLIHTRTHTHTNKLAPATHWRSTHNSAIVVVLFFLLLWPGYQHHHHHHHHHYHHHHHHHHHRLRHRARHRYQPHLRPVNSCSIVVAYLFHNTLIFEFILLVLVSSSCRFPFLFMSTRMCIRFYWFLLLSLGKLSSQLFSPFMFSMCALISLKFSFAGSIPKTFQLQSSYIKVDSILGSKRFAYRKVMHDTC